MLRIQLPKRLPYEVAVLAALLLGSCDQSSKSEFSMKQRDEIRDLASEATSQDRERIAAIEEKLNMVVGDDN
jgi:hypothetical protein